MRTVSAREFLFILAILTRVSFAQAGEVENQARYTMGAMRTIGLAISAYVTDHGDVPDANSVEALRPLLTPVYLKTLPATDGWQTPLHYVRTGANSCRIVSAGSDKRFEERSWGTPEQSPDFTADAVFEVSSQAGGTFTRSWQGLVDRPEDQTTLSPAMKCKVERIMSLPEPQRTTAIQTTETMSALVVLMLALENFRAMTGEFPAASSMPELQSKLFPKFLDHVPATDAWGTEFRYSRSGDGNHYTLTSAGADATFDQPTRTTPAKLASANDDAVVIDGEFVRAWDEKSAPGDTDATRERRKFTPAARAFLKKADQRLQAKDYGGALSAYMKAVDADPSVASLERIRAFSAPARYQVSDAPPPDGEATALRQYLRLHSDDWDATLSLLSVIDPKEAEERIQHFLDARPSDPNLYLVRGSVRFKSRRYMDALADVEKARDLDASNPERSYAVGTWIYEYVSSRSGALSRQQKRDLIARGIEALQTAERLKPDYFEALVYHGLLLHQQALIEEDSQKKQALTVQADALRERGKAIVKRRSGGTSTAPATEPSNDDAPHVAHSTPSPAPPEEQIRTPSPESTSRTDPGSEPLQVGGDVMAPIVVHRVEPVFPLVAEKARVSGTVIIRLVIDADGRMTDAQVIKPLPFGLSEAALEAVRKWRFKPATRGGKPVASIFSIPVTFPPPKSAAEK